jgi:hypothetical protein
MEGEQQDHVNIKGIISDDNEEHLFFIVEYLDSHGGYDLRPHVLNLKSDAVVLFRSSGPGTDRTALVYMSVTCTRILLV